MRLQITILALGLIFDIFIAGLIYRQSTTSHPQIQSEVLAYQDTVVSVESSATTTPTPSSTVSPSPVSLQVISDSEKAIQTLEPDSSAPSTPIETPKPTALPTDLPTPVSATATPLPTTTPNITAPAHLEPIFNRYSAEYGVDKNLLKSVAKCESSFNPGAVNGPYAGMYQYSESRWIENRQIMGLDPNPDLRFNAEEAIKTAAFFMVRGGITMWPNCH